MRYNLNNFKSLDSLKKLQSQRMLKSLKIDRIFSAQLNDLKYSLKQ
jgi:hypothetical protein